MKAPEAGAASATLPRAAALSIAWAAGAWQARAFGIWPAVGTTAVVLGVLALCLDRAALQAALRPEGRALGWGLAAGAVMTAATYVVYPVFAWIVPFLRGEVADLYLAFGRPGIGAALVALPVVILCEEIVWRGFVFEALSTRFSWVATILLGSAVYALAHAPVGSLALVLACLCVGVCWNALRWWSESLAAAVAAHLVWDLVVLIFWPLD